MNLFSKKLASILLGIGTFILSANSQAQTNNNKNLALYLCQIYYKYMPQAEAGLLMYVDRVSGEIRGIKNAKVTLPNGSVWDELKLLGTKPQKYDSVTLTPVTRSYMDGYLINAIVLDFKKGGDSKPGRISTFLNGRQTDLAIQSYASCREVKEN